MEAMFVAYFIEGRDISKRITLIDVVAEADLERQRAEAVLNSNDGLEAFKEAEGMSQRYRVDGVPYFISNGKITLGGAQPPEAVLEAFGKVVGGA